MVAARKLINIIKSMKNTLIQKLLPHTLQAIDRANGGYVLGETTNGLKPEGNKAVCLVSLYCILEMHCEVNSSTLLLVKMKLFFQIPS